MEVKNMLIEECLSEPRMCKNQFKDIYFDVLNLFLEMLTIVIIYTFKMIYSKKTLSLTHINL